MDNPVDHYEIEHEFHAAHRKAFLASVFSAVTGRTTSMVSLEEAKRLLKPVAESYRGRQPVPLDRIVGSEGRYQDFDRQFLPRKRHVAVRWRRVALAFRREIPLPAIQVYELGGLYFVRDGNHRVSVARSRGVKFLDAEVTSLATEIDVGSAASTDDIRKAITAYERRRFLEEVDLLDLLPGEEVRLTAPGAYDDLHVHIGCHRAMLESSRGRLTYRDATRSWYESIYLPLAKFIADSGVLAYAGGRTAADFYVWLVRHWEEIPTGRPAAASRLKRRFRAFLGRR